VSDRNAAKRRRSAQNKRERDARATRVAKARADAPTTSTPAAKAGRGKGRAASSRTPGPSSLGQRWTQSDSANPGARLVLFSVLLAVVAGLMLYFADIVPVDQDPGKGTAVETTSLGKEYGARVIPYLAIPVLITAAAWFSTRWSGRRRRRVYVVAAVMLWLWIMLNFTLGLLYIVSAVSLSIGAWQYVNALRANPEPADVDMEDDDDVDDDFDDDFDDVEEEVDEDGEPAARPTAWSRLKGPFGR
jgi:hypothetical protein